METSRKRNREQAGLNSLPIYRQGRIRFSNPMPSLNLIDT